MDAIRKQATRLREQVAKQQQAVLKQFYGSPDYIFTDEFELQQHQKLEKLFISTRAAKHCQRDLVRGVEGFIVTGSKQVEIGMKLSEDSRKYGADNTCTSGNTLSKAALNYAKARSQIEKERGTQLKAFGTQVAEPLRAMVMGAPLEDARHLAQRYDKMCQEVKAQGAEPNYVNQSEFALFSYASILLVKLDEELMRGCSGVVHPLLRVRGPKHFSRLQFTGRALQCLV